MGCIPGHLTRESLPGFVSQSTLHDWPRLRWSTVARLWFCQDRRHNWCGSGQTPREAYRNWFNGLERGLQAVLSACGRSPR